MVRVQNAVNTNQLRIARHQPGSVGGCFFSIFQNLHKSQRRTCVTTVWRDSLEESHTDSEYCATTVLGRAAENWEAGNELLSDHAGDRNHGKAAVVKLTGPHPQERLLLIRAEPGTWDNIRRRTARSDGAW